jgi:hypothetical protein
MVELADTLRLERSAERCESSSLSWGTKHVNVNLVGSNTCVQGLIYRFESCLLLRWRWRNGRRTGKFRRDEAVRFRSFTLKFALSGNAGPIKGTTHPSRQSIQRVNMGNELCIIGILRVPLASTQEKGVGFSYDAPNSFICDGGCSSMVRISGRDPGDLGSTPSSHTN